MFRAFLHFFISFSAMNSRLRNHKYNCSTNLKILKDQIKVMINSNDLFFVVILVLSYLLVSLVPY
jgi:hypothetical protein